jgi:hypothetical protein
MIDGADGAIQLQRYHPGGQPRQNDGEIGAFSFHCLLATRGVLTRTGQPLGHVIEGMHQDAHLVVGGEWQAHIEVAFGDCTNAGHQILDGPYQASRRPESAVQRCEQ